MGYKPGNGPLILVMQIFSTIFEMQEWSKAERLAGRTIAFVPTMGALHEGHLSLLREGKKRADKVAVSIYVNPTQFAPTEDLAKYPRDFDGDLAKARAEGVDAVFCPNDVIMYPKGYKTYVTVEKITNALCGRSRPEHFRGVTTIVAKLFNIVQPDIALFGEKDFQQLVVIQHMVRDLNMPIEIIGCPIVREKDGLAMSSRNKYLTQDERNAALALNKSLVEAERIIAAGETNAEQILTKVRSFIEDHGKDLVRIDYVKLVDAETLSELSEFRPPALLALAAFVRKTRLIDNKIVIGVRPSSLRFCGD